MTVHALLSAALIVGVGMIGGVSGAFSQTTGPVRPQALSQNLTGPDLFRMACATCHGRDGRGGGPSAPALKAPPPDLTLLAKSRQGVYPAGEIEAIIRGRTGTPAHGSAEMPMWGPIFQALDGSEGIATRRIRALVAHLESLQR